MSFISSIAGNLHAKCQPKCTVYKMAKSSSQRFALAVLAAFAAIVHHAASITQAANTTTHQATDTTSFLRCLAAALPPGVVYTNTSGSYTSVLHSYIKNLLFVTPTTPTPLAIVTPTVASHVQATVICSRRHAVRLRVRSGGHDYEGLSYRCLRGEAFAIVDLAALRAIRIDFERETAWVESGATLGELYYAIAKQSNRLGFPGGLGPTVGVGGHLSGGGFGTMLRKHGLAADHVVDATGRLLGDRASMGEDLFWAIRGGGGGSFGIVLSWKLRLVRVPETVTVFTVHRSRNRSATALLTKWQRVAPTLPNEAFLRVVLQNAREAQFESLYLGSCNNLIATMTQHFPELGVTAQDCIEMTWIESVLYFAFYGTGKSMELLLDRGTKPERYFKAKSDYVTQPVPSHVWESTWSWFLKDGAGLLILDPYGGRMGGFAPAATPFPHRHELYNLQYYGFWFENGTEASEKHMAWIRGMYKFMEPYVSKNPRAAYVNYRDLDIGVNDEAHDVTSYEKARVWGEKYFKANFERLAAVKVMVDPDDFFRNEQSIPPLPSSTKDEAHDD